MLENLQKLFDLIVEAPLDWFNGKDGKPDVKGTPKIEGVRCESYHELVEAWDCTYGKAKEKGERPKVALQWSDNIDVAFSVMLAVIASTKQQGAQVWLRVIGPPGSAKSTLCAALEANKQYVHTISKLTGFHSGANFGGASNSLLDKIKNMTNIVNEGDMIVSSPNKDTILSELRDLWGGKFTATYRNGQCYAEEGIRATFILAGTSTLRKLNKSSAGDRFIDVIIHELKIKGGEDEGERELLKTVARLAVERTKSESHETTSSQDTLEKVAALQKTVGFVKYLRESSPQRLGKVEVSKTILDNCINLAQLVAYLRARPDIAAKEGEGVEKELATRLTEQFIRLAICLSLVMDTEIDKEVMRRVAKVAKDTCKGASLDICEALLEKELDIKGLEARTQYQPPTLRHFKDVLLGLGCIRADNNRALSGATRRATGVYRLTPQMTGLLKNLYRLLGVQPKQQEVVK